MSDEERSDNPATSPAAAGKPRVLTLVFTDLVDSTALKTRLGDRAAAELIRRHHDLVRRLAGQCQGREVDNAGDGFFLTFDTPSAAASFALRLLDSHRAYGELPSVRVGVHLGEITERTAPSGSSPGGSQDRSSSKSGVM